MTAAFNDEEPSSPCGVVEEAKDRRNDGAILHRTPELDRRCSILLHAVSD